MKLNRKILLFAKSLRTGLFVVCFLAAAAMLSGCGLEGDLLSELRKEETDTSETAGMDVYGETFRENIPSVDGKDFPDTGESAGGKDVSDTGENAGREDVKAVAQSAGTRNLSDPGESVGAANAGEENGHEEIYVHVCGAVKNPGVYALPAGSRFYEAVEAAGGYTAEACGDYLNMAAPLSDGSRLEIPTLEEIKKQEKAVETAGEQDAEKAEDRYYTLAEEVSAADTQSAAADGNMADTKASPEGVVNINTAGMEELCSLPGVGEGRAKAIIEYRETRGSFQKKEDIMQVSGIGEKMYARMEAYLAVE